MSEIQNITPGLIPIREWGGREVVYGRELHEFLQIGRDYSTWFKQMLEYGFSEGRDFSPLLGESTGGRPSVDHALTLDMAKELSMIQRTERGKQARLYFIEVEKRARQMFAAPALPDLSTPEGVLALAQTLTKTAEDLVAAKSEIAELAPKADAWDGLASGSGTYAVGDAAKMLCQVGIETGRDRLFEFMQGISWVYRRSGRWQAMQHAVNAGRLMHKPQSHPHPETGEIVLDAPQVRVTMKGLNELRALMLPPIPRLQLVGEVA